MKRAAFSHIPIGQIREGRNVRKDLYGIEDLADSLRRHGMLQAITVVPTADGGEVECLFGHRRLAAAHIAKLAEVPCFLRGRGNEQQRLLTQCAENFDREDMTPLDEALAFRDLVASGLSQLQISSLIHRSDFYVSTRMSLLKYPECVQAAVHERRISVSTALLIPLDLLGDPRRVDTLAKVLSICVLGKVTPVKDWITVQLRAEQREIPHHTRRRRYLEVDLDHYELAAGAAAILGLPLYDWTADVVEAAARVQAKR